MTTSKQNIRCDNYTTCLERLLVPSLSILLACAFAWINYALHENRLWFSNIKEVEREISFRTECGLYYSYYKQIINATESDKDNIWLFYDSIVNLKNDRSTEAPHSINIIQRFNIFQEILLALLYRISESVYYTAIKLLKSLYDLSTYVNIPSFLTPIFFYVYGCFAFSGFGIFAIYWLTFILSKNKANLNSEAATALLAVAWIFSHLEDATRVNFSVNLRENFALSVFWFQNIFVIRLLQSLSTAKLHLQTIIQTNYLCIAISTFILSAFWQFNQFILILQSCGLFTTFLLLNCDSSYNIKVLNVIFLRLFLAQTVGFLLLIPLQEFQSMLLTSIFIQFNFAIIFSIKLVSFVSRSQNPSKLISVFHLLVVFFWIIIQALIRNYLFNVHVDDSHIWMFASAKVNKLYNLLYNYKNFSLKELEQPFPLAKLAEHSFESTIYLCHGAFAFIDVGFFERTLKSGLLPLYLTAVLITGIFCLYIIFNFIFENKGLLTKKLKTSIDNNINDESFINPSVIYFVIQSFFSAIMAIMMLRLKFLWLPQMAVISAYFTSKLLKTCLRWHLRTTVIIALVGILLAKRLEIFRLEMKNEQEFYDPDTVELMEWISAKTQPDAIFAGSMQLMAGIKCCTNRPIANHPHFEDKWLRERTRRLYQIYSKKSPGKVHAILREENVDFIIVEESICFIPPNGCTTNELIDLDNGEIPQLLKELTSEQNESVRLLKEKGFSKSETKRFCSAVQQFGKESRLLFKLIFQNRTFRIYKVI